MLQALVSKLEQRGPLSAEERRVIEAAVARVRDVAADEDIVHEGECPTESSLMLVGFSARYKILSNGRRQITALHVLGDFVDLHSFLLAKMDHGVVALTPCRIGVVPHDELRAISDRYPNLTRLL